MKNLNLSLDNQFLLFSPFPQSLLSSTFLKFSFIRLKKHTHTHTHKHTHTHMGTGESEKVSNVERGENVLNEGGDKLW